MAITRLSKIIMPFCLALFALLCAGDNIVDYGANFTFVRHVLSMDTVHDPAVLGRAITAPALWHAGYWLIIAGEAATGLLLAAGSYEMWKCRRATARDFQAAKRWVQAGALAGFLVWFFGFMVIGGEWFQMWQSAWNGQEGAFRFYMTVLAVIIFVSQPDAEIP
jgi:predicted small integral membrane protein